MTGRQRRLVAVDRAPRPVAALAGAINLPREVDESLELAA